MVTDIDFFKSQVADIIRGGATPISDVRPSVWTEQNVMMGKPFPGPFSYSRTPYTREIIDCMAPDHPARRIAVMKGAQVGFSSGVIYPAIGWIIKNAPGNSFVTVGAPDLIEKAMEKLDLMIDNASLRPYIKPSVTRNRANKSGDTNNKKEFSGGYVTVASANNHKAIRQVDLQYGFFDDFESIKSASKESGSTRKLLEQRFAAYADTCKIFYISTPELKATSNIEPAYLLGDQRKYLVPCPCCHELIELKWAVELDGEKTGGIFWRTDGNGRLERGSVGYVCQICAGFFTDKTKHQMLNSGIWRPTATPSTPDFYSYHLSSLYAPIGMYDWEHYVNDYIEANPPEQPRDEDLYKTFVNVCLGETYEGTAEAPKANSIQKNTRAYEIGTIPEKLSIEDGNGRIVLLTCAADMNGKEDDCRLDYEIVAWAENGATYSVLHGSLGTFIPRENTLKHKVDRAHWTYDAQGERSVWPLFELIVSQEYKTDTGRSMRVFTCGLDCGHFATTYAYPFLERTQCPVQGVKGDKEGKYTRFGHDAALIKHAAERKDLWILQVGLIKDKLAAFMELRWKGDEENQPANFMNFPQAGIYICPIKAAYHQLHGEEYAGDALYQYPTFFQHFESEHRVVVNNSDGVGEAFRWVKKGSTVMNHMWDVRIYNIATREIIIKMFAKELKRQDFSWKDFVELALSEL